ncbi:MAG: glycosyltransferase [Gemmatimonadales bacterium]|nr:glycosyltransferase [Gemmatimonadales bacterium]
MNLLFASCISTWGGGENWMLSAMLGLRERGHKVVLAGRSGSELVNRAEAENVPCVEIDYRGDFDPIAFWRFFRLCRAQRIDVLCLNMQRVLRVAGPAARLAGVGGVIPRVGSQSPLGGNPYHIWTWKHVADGIIANSQATGRTLLKSATWLPPDRVRVIYNGLHLDRFVAATGQREAARARLGTSLDVPVIGMIGELTTRKNHILVLRQLPYLVAKFPGLKLWILGAGDQKEVLSTEAARLGVSENLVLAGFRSDVPDLIPGMDVLAHPALMEGFGYVIVEAMAAGLPVVAADTSNLPEIIDDGATGWLVSPADGPIWARRLEELLTDTESAGKMGQEGSRQARQRFGFERMLDELEAYFEEFVKPN